MKKWLLEFWQNEDGWIPLAIAGVTALGSYLSGRDKKKQDTSETSESTSTTTPEYDPQLLGARNTLLQSYLDRMQGGQGWLKGYTGQGLRTINQAGDIRSKTMSNILAARGLSSSPVAANLLSGADNQRLEQQINFLNQVPILGREQEGEDMRGLASYIASLPKGTRSYAKGSNVGQTSAYGSNVGAIGQGLSNAVAAFLKAKQLYE